MSTALSALVGSLAPLRARGWWKPAFVAAICIILFLRLPTCLTLDEFFTDDGSTFFRDQLLFGPAAVFQRFPQYLNFIPRLCALVAAPFPMVWLPRLYAIEALLIAGCCCSAFALAEFRPLLASDAQRSLLCLISAVALPAQELIGTIAHLQWFLALVAIPCALLPPKSRPVATRARLALLAAAIALSGPLPIVLIPAIGFEGLRRRRFTEFQIGLIAGTAIEWAVIARNGIAPAARTGLAGLDRLVFQVFAAFSNQVGLLSLFGRRPAVAVFVHHYGGASLLLVLALVALQAALFVKGSREYRIKVALLAWLIFSSIALAVLRGMPYPEMSSVQPFGAHRYFYPACWCFALLILLAVEHFNADWPQWKRCGLVILIFLFAGIQNFRLTPRTNSGWQKYIPQIQAWKADVEARRSHAAFAVACNPPGWLIEFPKLDRGKPQF